MIKRFIFLHLLLFSLFAFGKTVVQYSHFASKTQTDHSVSLPKFIRYIAEKKVTGVVDGFNIKLQNEILLDKISNVELVFKNSSISSNVRFEGALLKFSNFNNIKISGLHMAMHTENLSVYKESEYPKLYNAGLIFINGKDVYIDNSVFSALYSRSVEIKNTFGAISLVDNVFTSPMQFQSFLAEHIVIGSCPNATVNVLRNAFINAPYANADYGISAISGYGLGKNGGSVTIKDNKIDYAGRNNSGHHRLYAIDFYDDCDNINIVNNTLNNIMWGGIRFNGTSENANITGNKITVINPDDTGTITSSTTERNSTFRNIVIANNIIIALKSLNSAILLQNQYKDCLVDNVNIKNNVITDSYYNIYLTGFFEGVAIENNRLSGLNSAFGVFFILNAQNKNGILNQITGNTIDANNTGISINTKENAKSNASFSIENNSISNTKRSEGFGVLVNIGAKGNVNLKNNTISNFGKGLYLREKGSVLKSNKMMNNVQNILTE